VDQEEAKQENDILLDLKEKEVKLKPHLEVMLHTIPQFHSYALHCPNLGIEVNITRKALLSLFNEKVKERGYL